MSSKGEERSRVGRPRQLETAEVVEAALQLCDEAGLDALSMPKLARRLGVGTMTLYGYVENKEDLLDRMARRIFEDLEAPETGDWEHSTISFFVEFRRKALQHPTLASLLATGRITIPAVFDILEATLQIAEDADIAEEEAVRRFYAALAYTIGFVVWEIPRARLQGEAEYGGQWAELLAALDQADYPRVTGKASEVFPTVASDGQFRFGLRRVLAV